VILERSPLDQARPGSTSSFAGSVDQPRLPPAIVSIAARRPRPQGGALWLHLLEAYGWWSTIRWGEETIAIEEDDLRPDVILHAHEGGPLQGTDVERLSVNTVRTLVELTIEPRSKVFPTTQGIPPARASGKPL
jgi:hypothetical protein